MSKNFFYSVTSNFKEAEILDNLPIKVLYSYIFERSWRRDSIICLKYYKHLMGIK